MLVEAAYWRPESRPPAIEVALARPDLSYLLAEWGREGDAGVVAEGEGQPLGCAWFRTWTNELHSYGFIDERTPELVIGVVLSCRRQGVGYLLLRRLAELARRMGFRQLSLSVEPANPAMRLYERIGFRRHSVCRGAHTMRLILGPTHR